ncbi:hypothetical protein TeGR_g1961 [Tetraparma gracilis]|uniref:Uncharacterized protein n=1 Tax=Tetraparma gracilis TaxID=2962635 RepID=A0ABQ6MQ99_9STRA|nr:hypothetical protein TeGR_g1961 [Tetraparma gracilis]
MFAEAGTNTAAPNPLPAAGAINVPPIPNLATAGLGVGPFHSPPTSPLLTSLVPRRPVKSSKPWNCVTQQQIDSCIDLLNLSASAWSPKAHKVFEPNDRRGILEVLRVGKRMEQTTQGIHILDMWPVILSFCGRGWFKPSEGTKSICVGEDEAAGRDAAAGRDSESSSDDAEFTQFSLDAGVGESMGEEE